MTGADLITEARKLVGIPWVHAGRNQYGVDCLGLILVPARTLGFTEFEPVTYSPGGEEGYLMQCIQQLLLPVEEAMQPGDIALFRMRDRLQHLAYLTGTGTMLHSRERLGVVESTIDERWQERIAGIYRWKALAGD